MIQETPKILMCYEGALDRSVERCGSMYKNGTKNTEKFSNSFLNCEKGT
ncbi:MULTISPECIES: hypothetical protein [unclassified Archaeoglobus]|jgi:hypothetical protein|nr:MULTISPECIES: hypothetical protein [unclassified Archaeoglobus]